MNPTSTAPLSKIRIARGACVAFASIPPSIGSPVPMNATSPSRISRAAQIAISSVGLNSIAIVHLATEDALRLQPLQPHGPELLQVARVAPDLEDPLLEEPLEPLEGAALRGVHLPELPVQVVVPLDLVRVGAPRDVHDCVPPERAPDRAVAVRPPAPSIHQL